MRTRYTIIAAMIALVAGAIAGCADSDPTVVTSITAVQSALRAGVPDRDQEARGPRWSRQNDTLIWNAAAGSDTLFSIALKEPGSVRGNYRSSSDDQAKLEGRNSGDPCSA